MQKVEIWKDVIDYDKYQVSSLGNIRRSGKILCQMLTHRGYKVINLCKDGKCKMFLVHRVIVKSFINPNIGTRNLVNHINGIQTDNRLENLELVNDRENKTHSLIHLNKKGTSKYTGVCKATKCNRWRAEIGINGKGVFLGHFLTEEEASAAYQKALKDHNTTNSYAQ